MRMSCNGCRVLRKGCSDDCTIRPCLQWIKSPESQANATLFLAKFYGRAGFLNLIEASPLHLRPATFWSLLHEACGRIVCPVYGLAGLLGSGNWAQCQAAVEAVLKGSPIGSSQMPPPPLPTDAHGAHVVAPPKTYDIRHVSRDPTNSSRFSAELHRVRNRPRFKHMSLGRPNFPVAFNNRFYRTPAQVGGFERGPAVLNSSVSWPGNSSKNSSTEDQESLFSVETVEGSLVKGAEPDRVQTGTIDLDLTLGSAPI